MSDKPRDAMGVGASEPIRGGASRVLSLAEEGEGDTPKTIELDGAGVAPRDESFSSIIIRTSSSERTVCELSPWSMRRAFC